mgnify:CR=1 FL=1
MKLFRVANDHFDLCDDCGIAYKTMWMLLTHKSTRFLRLCVFCKQRVKIRMNKWKEEDHEI